MKSVTFPRFINLLVLVVSCMQVSLQKKSSNLIRRETLHWTVSVNLKPELAVLENHYIEEGGEFIKAN
jgi:hypothetical protein